MNELSIIFNKMGIDTRAVLEAAGTKWNFLKFYPGLVGGHCIGVDPYYLTYKAEELGYHSQIILSGRRINDGMGKYVAESTVKNLIKANKQIKGARVGILGFTFKENCPDTRNSKIIDIVNELEEYGVVTFVTDPIAEVSEVKYEYGIDLYRYEELNSLDGVILAVPHKEYEELTIEKLNNLFTSKDEINNEVAATLERNNEKVIIDIKGILNRKEVEEKEYLYWRL